MLKEVSDIAREVSKHGEVSRDIEARIVRLERAIIAMWYRDTGNAVFDEIESDINNRGEFNDFIREYCSRKED